MPLSSEKNYVSSFSQSLWIGSLSNLQVMRIGIKARMSLNLGRIGLFTLKLFALERGFFSPMDFDWKKVDQWISQKLLSSMI